MRAAELVVDSFAGGGGASLGIEWALRRSPDLAVNHDAAALAMHRANHPATEHLCQNIWQVDPAEIAKRGPIGLLWASPDCTHHSKAKGGKPKRQHIRDLAWVVVLWAERARPRVICLENVEEFAQWGPLDGEGMPIASLRGLTFKRWVRQLQKLGYRVEWRELRACDYGTPTIRKRLFLVARRDGEAIRWPAPTHGPGLAPYRAAAECIDWSLPCPSIFLSREEGRARGVNRPLAEATMARIAKGVWRFVIDAAEPFIVPITHVGDDRVHAIGEPLRTVTTAHRGEFAIVAPYFVPRYGERPGQEPRCRDIASPMATVVPGGNGGDLVAPFLVPYYGQRREGDCRAHTLEDALATQTTENRFGLIAAFLAQHNSGMTGHRAGAPVSTIVDKGCTQALVASHLVKLRGTCRDGQPLEAPAPTITAGGWHLGEVRAFLAKYYGRATAQDLREPLHTVSTRGRFGLVTIAGEPWRIVDIGMRMLSPRELFRAQGFPDSYVIDPEIDGKPMTKTAQIRACGNSVCPQVAAAVVRANLAEMAEERAA